MGVTTAERGRRQDGRAEGGRKQLPEIRFGDTKAAADREFYVGSGVAASSKRNQGHRSRGPGLELTIITTFPPISQLPTLSRCALPFDCDISLLGRHRRDTSGCDSQCHFSCSSTGTGTALGTCTLAIDNALPVGAVTLSPYFCSYHASHLTATKYSRVRGCTWLVSLLWLV